MTILRLNFLESRIQSFFFLHMSLYWRSCQIVDMLAWPERTFFLLRETDECSGTNRTEFSRPQKTFWYFLGNRGGRGVFISLLGSQRIKKFNDGWKSEPEYMAKLCGPRVPRFLAFRELCRLSTGYNFFALSILASITLTLDKRNWWLM